MNQPSRMFELENEKSSKFWEISVDDQNVTTRWGRIGTNGQSKTKEYDSLELAREAADKTIAQKQKKGYVEIGTTAEAAASEAPSSAPAAEDAADSEDLPAAATEAAPFPQQLVEMLTGQSDLVTNAVAPVLQSLARELLPSTPAVSAISLEPVEGFFDDESLAVSVSETLQQAGYELSGDFRVPELGLHLRALFRPPNVFAVVYDLNGLQWLDLHCSFVDDTYGRISHTWTTSQLHDGEVPPWATLHHLPGCDLADLLGLLAEFEAARPASLVPESLSAEMFGETFTAAYEKETRWRTDGTVEIKSRRPTSDSQNEIDQLADKVLQRVRGDGYEYEGFLCESRLNRIERLLSKTPLSDYARDTLRVARDTVKVSEYDCRDQAPRILQIDRIVGDNVQRLYISKGEAWANQVIADVNEMEDEQVWFAWCDLIAQCVTATASKPSANWKKKAVALIDRIGADEVRERLQHWLPLINQPREDVQGTHFLYSQPLAISEANQIILRGLIWCYSFIPDERMPQLLATVGMSAYRKIPHIGARAAKVGNACVFAIGAQANAEAVAQLAVMKTKVKTATARKLIERQLDATAEKQGITRAELEEISVPTYGMQEIGRLTESMGDFTAVLGIDRQKVRLTWQKQDGKEQKSVPAAIKRDFADDLKELKAAAKDIEKMLSAQKSRIESLYLTSSSWSFGDWKERYLDHPLVGVMARRLLWTFQSADGTNSVAGMHHDGQLVDHSGSPLTVPADATVRLWHPLNEPAETVLAWRVFLEEREICQPFRQAHREVYLLTDAERTTSTYSNRQAAHILVQTQYRSLAQARRWNVNFLGAWDGGDMGIAERHLEPFDMRAEFWVTGIYDETEREVRHVSTDQVRFYQPRDEQDPMELIDVPPIVFSEIMRDVDLFVGVASVGNDPNWQDGGPQGAYRDYWHSYSFGELTETAATRRQVLERLLPRLKIADQCHLEDRFLVVKGTLRTYKIHLGSSNILMAPNDQYLCIVQSRSRSEVDRISLPFEGDHTLSVILSKAFLLAADTKIKDPTILHQIQQT